MNRNEMKARIAGQLMAPQIEDMLKTTEKALQSGVDIELVHERSKRELEGCVQVAELIMLECKL